LVRGFSAPDAELEELARAHGPFSIEAKLSRELRKGRAKDRQVFAFKVGDYYFTGPIPDARGEQALIRLADVDEEDDDSRSRAGDLPNDRSGPCGLRPSVPWSETRPRLGCFMSQRQSQNYRVPEVSWQALLAVDWRGGLLVLLFLTTLLLLGLTAFVLGPGPEATVM
jgi:hypothetical protein